MDQAPGFLPLLHPMEERAGELVIGHALAPIPSPSSFLLPAPGSPARLPLRPASSPNPARRQHGATRPSASRRPLPAAELAGGPPCLAVGRGALLSPERPRQRGRRASQPGPS